jgi:hypothetical protein
LSQGYVEVIARTLQPSAVSRAIAPATAAGRIGTAAERTNRSNRSRAAVRRPESYSRSINSPAASYAAAGNETLYIVTAELRPGKSRSTCDRRSGRVLVEDCASALETRRLPGQNRASRSGQPLTLKTETVLRKDFSRYEGTLEDLRSWYRTSNEQGASQKHPERISDCRTRI